MATARVVSPLQARWRTLGLPGFAQFDNDTRFQRAHPFPDIVGCVGRLWLQLGLTPFFTPLNGRSFQPALDSFNGRAGQVAAPLPLPLTARPPDPLPRVHFGHLAAREWAGR